MTEQDKKAVEISDEELTQATGGMYVSPGAEDLALADGHPALVKEIVCNCSLAMGDRQVGKAECYTIFAEKKAIIEFGLDEYRNCKCYGCGTKYGNINTLGRRVT